MPLRAGVDARWLSPAQFEPIRAGRLDIHEHDVSNLDRLKRSAVGVDLLGRDGLQRSQAFVVAGLPDDGAIAVVVRTARQAHEKLATRRVGVGFLAVLL